ncbi:MAG: tRNA (N6-isopentenyl adenosine(37)-C2)-methylthiotransferase MiaB [Candidatus Acidiferrales bacterium]
MAARIDIALASLLGKPSGVSADFDASQARSFYIETFGCQMNAHDSEKVAGLLLARGYRQVESPDSADMVLFNTCSIREKAAQKVFTRLNDFRGPRGQSKIVGVLGCVAQQEGEHIFERAPWVRMVCGSASYRNLPELLTEIEAGGTRVTGLNLDTDETFETEVTRRDNPFRAYLTIIEGCDYACSYCVVPHTRGPQRSRTSASVLNEVKHLVEGGFTEVQLLGQTVNSYRDPSTTGMNFAQLLYAVAAVPGIRRVRFTTSHPNDFTREIVRAIDSTPALCDHIHLPVQSGSNRVLREMRRTYTRDDYMEKIAWVRSAQRRSIITTDIIVGFPGETGAEFGETISLLDEVKFDGVFAFKYSPRPNTAAKDMADPVPEDVKSQRLAILQQRQREIQISQNQTLLGSEFEVLVDGRHESRAQWSGRTTSNRIVNFTSPAENLLGQYCHVKITGAGANSLIGAHLG